MSSAYLDINADVQQALSNGQAVVALESTIISHGLPWPENLHCAQRLEAIIRAQGAVPATIALVQGRIKIGLQTEDLERFARAENIAKVSRRDLAAVLSGKQDGATTVAATMLCAHLAGIRVFATGGIGGVHRGVESNWDISADLTELGRTPLAVVCAGAKSILDLPKTLEVLETQGVPVLGYKTAEFPAFFQTSSALPVSLKVDDIITAARLIHIQQQLQLGGAVLAVPIPATAAIAGEELDSWLNQALAEAEQDAIMGKDLTPYLLKRLVELSKGRTLQANLALIENNVTIAAQLARQLLELS